MEATRLAVGDQYPGQLPKDREGLWPRLVRGGLHILLLLDIREGDIEDLRHKDLQVGTLTTRSIPFISLFVKRWGTLDGHINILQYTEDSVDDYFANFGNRFTLLALEIESQKILLMRQLGVKMEIANSVLNGMNESREAYDDPRALEEAAAGVYDQFEDPQDFASQCTEKQVFRGAA